MKIAYLIPGCGVSGGIAVVCQHASRLLSRGHQVYLISQTEEKSLTWFPDLRVPVLTLDEYPDGIDILVATGWSTSFDAINLRAKEKFYFVQSDETRFHPKDDPYRYLTALSYLVNFNYLTEARWIQRWLQDNFNHDAVLIPNGLDETIFYPDLPLVPKGNKPRVLLEGAISLPYKGMEDAFAAVADLDVEIWCVSSYGKPKPEWKCDRFFEQVPMTEMRRVYSSCDVLLKLSRVEGFFGPPMEMMACGGTVVVGKVTGYDEYIVDGYNALVVEPGDIPAARSAVARILSDSKLRNQLVENGRATANSWNWDNSIDHLEAHFSNVLQDGASRPLTLVREDINKGVLFFSKLLMQQSNYVFITHPIDLIFVRLRKIKLLRWLAEVIYFAYVRLKQFIVGIAQSKGL
jgi:O-antigen biosynthesis protein